MRDHVNGIEVERLEQLGEVPGVIADRMSADRARTLSVAPPVVNEDRERLGQPCPDRIPTRSVDERAVDEHGGVSFSRQLVADLGVR